MNPLRTQTRRRRRALLSALVGVALAAAAAAQPAEPAPRWLPVYDLEAGEAALSVEIAEARYGPASVFDIGALDLPIPALAAGDAGAVALAYMGAVLGNRLDRLESFFSPRHYRPRAARQAAQLYRTMLGVAHRPLERLRLERVWHFGAFRVVLMRAEAAASSRLFSVSLEVTGDGVVRRDDWGDWQAVHQLLWYMARNAEKGLEGRVEPRTGPFVVSFEPDGESRLRLAFDGTRYPRDAPFEAVAEAEADLATAAGFLRWAAQAATLEEQAFIALWRGEEREDMAAALAEDAATARGARGELAAIARVRDVFTLDLGRYVVHYYFEAAEPTTLEARVLERADGAFWLSDELYANVDQVVRSRPMKAQILDLAAGTGGR